MNNDQKKPTHARGFNPNLKNAKAPKKIVSPKTNKPNIHNMFEAAEPGVEFADIYHYSNVYDVPSPQQEVIGKITLRKNFIDEMVEMSDSVLMAGTHASSLPNPPRFDNLASFFINYCLATQGFSTLKIENKQGPIYKLKALATMDISVPKFIANLTTSIGSFSSQEGIISIAGLSQLVPNLAIQAIRDWLQIPDVKTLGIKNEAVEGTFYFWNSPTIVEDLKAYLDMYFPDTLTDVEIRVSDTMTKSMSIDWTTDFAATDALITNMDLTADMDNDLRARRRAYLRLAQQEFNTWHLPNNNNSRETLNIAIGDVANNITIKSIVNDLSFISSYFIQKYKRTITNVFKCDVFRPSAMGTTSQFVTHSDTSVPLSSVEAQHPHHISGSSAVAGIILCPSQSVEVNPRYTTYSNTTRMSLVSEYSDSFMDN